MNKLLENCIFCLNQNNLNRNSHHSIIIFLKTVFITLDIKTNKELESKISSLLNNIINDLNNDLNNDSEVKEEISLIITIINERWSIREVTELKDSNLDNNKEANALENLNEKNSIKTEKIEDKQDISENKINEELSLDKELSEKNLNDDSENQNMIEDNLQKKNVKHLTIKSKRKDVSAKKES